MLTLTGGTKVLSSFNVGMVSLTILGMLVIHGLMRERQLEEVAGRAGAVVTGVVVALMSFAIVLTQGSNNAFIYFQF
jgi:hypothetical protein